MTRYSLLFFLSLCGFAGLVHGNYEWELVFRAKAGSGKSVYDAWLRKRQCGCSLSTGCIPFHKEIPEDMTPSGGILRSPLIDCWENEGIKKVRVQLRNGNTVVAFLLFDGEKTSKTNWFSNAKLLDSSWNDLRGYCPCQRFKYFSMAGHKSRKFFVQKSYGDCPYDKGWFVVQDYMPSKKYAGCPWDKFSSRPQFLYNNAKRVATWQQGNKPSYHKAEIFEVYISRQG